MDSIDSNTKYDQVNVQNPNWDFILKLSDGEAINTEIVLPITKLQRFYTNGTRSVIYKLLNNSQGRSILLKSTIIQDSLNHSNSKIIKLRPIINAPWLKEPPRIGTYNFTLYEQEEYQRIRKYLSTAHTVFIYSQPTQPSNWQASDLVEGITLTRFIGFTPHDKNEQKLAIEKIKALPEGTRNLKILTDGLRRMLNETGCLPDLNFGLLANNNFIIDSTGRITLIDFLDQIHLPDSLMDKLRVSNRTVVNDKWEIDPIVVAWIDENKIYLHPEIQKLPDWIDSIAFVNSNL